MFCLEARRHRDIRLSMPSGCLLATFCCVVLVMPSTKQGRYVQVLGSTLAKCQQEARMYGTCVKASMTDLQHNACATEFKAFQTCFKSQVSWAATAVRAATAVCSCRAVHHS